MISLIPADIELELGARFGERFAQLDETGVQAVVTARLEGAVSNGRLQEVTGAHPKDITTVLQSLVRDGLLEQQNQKRWASYRLTGDSPHTGANSPHSGLDSPHTEANFPHSALDSPHNESQVIHSSDELTSLTAPAREKQRLRSAEMHRIIAAACAGRWLTAKELGRLLNRDPENLQERFLTGMVREGVLELRFPGVRNRPDQAYRTVVNLRQEQ
jgi:ATP-dependent DNA helicase RecG